MIDMDLLKSQRSPVKLGGQVHMYNDKPMLVQVPLLRQKVLLQAPIAKQIFKNIDNVCYICT